MGKLQKVTKAGKETLLTAFGKSTETSLRDYLAEQGIAEVRRIKARRDGELREIDA